MDNTKKPNKLPVNPVRTIRKELSLTQEQFAEKLEVTSDYISMLETGKKQPSNKLARKISKLATAPAPVEWLTGATEYRTDSQRFAAFISKKQEEGDLLFNGLWSFAFLNGYEIIPPDWSDHDAAKIIQAAKAGYLVSKDGEAVTLTMEEMNRLENEV